MADAIVDWEIPTREHRARWLAWVLVAALGGACGAVGAAVAHVAGVPEIAGTAAGLVLVAAYTALCGRMALRAAGARRAAPGEVPRLASLVNGLSEDLRIRSPTIWLYDGGGPNALVCRSGAGAVAVARTALHDLTRVELEALVAHCLVRLSGGASTAATIAALGLAFARLMGPIVDERDDVRAAAVTRYPPALASVLEKSDLARGRYGPFYFAADGPSHLSVHERVQALLDL